MKYGFFRVMTVAVLGPVFAVAQQTAPGPAGSGRALRTGDGHPDLSGTWALTINLPSTSLKKAANGSVAVNNFDRGVAAVPATAVPGVLPSTPAPSYKPEFQEKVKYLSENESKVDQVFYCGKPGIPRIGPPRRIVQLPGEMIFLYEDISGDPYRIIPADGRAHRANANPSYYGDAVAHWEGDTLVIDVTNFVEDTWFGENGYLHTDAMHVTERLWRDGENLVWQVTVEDPKVLTAPWTMSPRMVKSSKEPLEESPRCVEDDGHRLLNNDHHRQR